MPGPMEVHITQHELRGLADLARPIVLREASPSQDPGMDPDEYRKLIDKRRQEEIEPGRRLRRHCALY